MSNRHTNLPWFLLVSFPVLLLVAYQVSFRYNTKPSTTNRNDIAVVYAGISAFSHLEKAQPLIAGLVELGYPVTFVTGEDHRAFCMSTGAHFEPLDGPNGVASEEEFARFLKDPKGEELPLAKAAFIGHMHEHLNTIQRVFKRLQSKYKKVVYIHDTSFFALLPVQLGAPGILPSVSIGLGITNIALDSHDTFPFPATKGPDSSENARRIHRRAYQNINNPLRLAFDEALAQKLKEMDAIGPYPGFYHALGAYDQYLAQIGLPEFEYNRTDIVPKVRFLGPPETTGGSRDLPSWWQDVLTARKEGKRIVVVTQGTVSPNLQFLLVPTITALAARDDILVVGTTVTQGTDIQDFELPANARLAQFIPFDLLLKEASLVVSNGGYGTVLHAIRAGVPMVLAGTQQDKEHITTLADYIGIAVNLKTDQPTVGALRTAVARVLGEGTRSGNNTYRDNVVRLRQASLGYQPTQRLDAVILEAVSV